MINLWYMKIWSYVYRDGIRVNCVIPGFVNTPIVDTVPDHLKGMILFATPMKRMGEPEGMFKFIL